MNLLIRLAINALALFVVAYLIPGVSVTGIAGAIVAALVLGVVNAIIRPILILISLPLEILTLGLFTFVINAFLFWIVGHLGIGYLIAAIALGGVFLREAHLFRTRLLSGNNPQAMRLFHWSITYLSLLCLAASVDVLLRSWL